MIKLNESGILFDEAEHTYATGDGEERHGITKCINSFINPDKYNAVPEAVLAAAAERGHAIHSAIENYNTLGLEVSDFKEFEDFKTLKELHKLTHVASEYIVTDGEFYASPIDWVAQDDDCAEDEVILIDFKSTSSIDVLRVSAQLTIYKMLFEKQNPHLKVKKIGSMWLPKEQYGNARLEWETEFDHPQMQMMMDAFRYNMEFEPITLVKAEPLPVPVERVEATIGQWIAIEKAAKAYLSKLKETLLQGMIDDGISAYKGEHLTISIKKGYSRSGGYDTEAMLAKLRELGVSDKDIEVFKKPDTMVADSITLKYK